MLKQELNKKSLAHNDYLKMVKAVVNSNPENCISFHEGIYDITIKHVPILVDGVFFQLYQTGIVRVWIYLLEEWLNNGFAKYITVLDRAGTAPKIPGIRYRSVPPYDYKNTDADREMLQQLCDEEDAEVFISSYYTTPTTIHFVLVVYDMIPLSRV